MHKKMMTLFHLFLARVHFWFFVVDMGGASPFLFGGLPSVGERTGLRWP